MKTIPNQRLKFSKIAVIVILAQVFIYNWVHLIMSFIMGIEIAPTTSCAFYGFCGAEAGLLAWIKKIDKPKDEVEEAQYERDFSTEVDEP